MKSSHVDWNVENILYGHVKIDGGVGCDCFISAFIPELFEQVPKTEINTSQVQCRSLEYYDHEIRQDQIVESSHQYQHKKNSRYNNSRSNRFHERRRTVYCARCHTLTANHQTIIMITKTAMWMMLRAICQQRVVKVLSWCKDSLWWQLVIHYTFRRTDIVETQDPIKKLHGKNACSTSQLVIIMYFCCLWLSRCSRIRAENKEEGMVSINPPPRRDFMTSRCAILLSIFCCTSASLLQVRSAISWWFACWVSEMTAAIFWILTSSTAVPLQSLVSHSVSGLKTSCHLPFTFFLMSAARLQNSTWVYHVIDEYLFCFQNTIPFQWFKKDSSIQNFR